MKFVCSTVALSVLLASSGVIGSGDITISENSFNGGTSTTGVSVGRGTCASGPTDTPQTLALRATVANIKARADTTNSVTWDEFTNLGVGGNDALPIRVNVTEADFASGTLRVRRPAHLILTENIAFNPNAGFDNGNWDPICNVNVNESQTEYCDTADDVHFAYKLGFFAAVALECSHCIVDLNGFTLAQHEAHALQQRFFALVELADQPFVPSQGPGNFGTTVNACTNCGVVGPGTLGLSAHHGIHGNGASDVLIDSVTFENYEVAAVHLNGVQRTTVVDCDARGSRTDIPTIATYSQGRFLAKFVSDLLKELEGGEIDNDIWNALNGAHTNLTTAMENAFKNIITDGHGAINATDFPVEFDLFANEPVTLPSGVEVRIVDGNSYGIHAHVKGVGVNDFFEGHEAGSLGGDGSLARFEVIRTTVNGTLGNIKEVVTVSQLASDKPQGGVAGETMRLDKMTNVDGTYKSNPLSELHLLLANFRRNDTFFNATSRSLGGFAVDASLYDWSQNTTQTIDDYVENNGSKFLCNTDAMSHIQKGVIGLVVQGSRGFVVKNTTVSDTVNMGAIGETKRCGQYYKYKDNTLMTGYTGAHSAGVCVKGATDVDVNNLRVYGVHSNSQDAIGVQYMNMAIGEVPQPSYMISGMTTGAANERGTHYPNGVPRAIKYVEQ